MRNPRKMIIIGAGVSGLSAGIYAQTHGFHTAIYEKNSAAGGNLCGWTAQGAAVEGSLRLLTGTREDSALYRCWCAVGALGSVLVVHPESFFAAQEGGRTAVLWQDLDRFRSACEELSPADTELVGQFCAWVERLKGFAFRTEKPADLCNPFEAHRAAGRNGEAGRLLARLDTIALAGWAARIQEPALRRAFTEAVPRGASLGELALQYALFCNGDSAMPMGGSRPLIDRMVRRYLEVGGELQLSAPVEEIVVAHGAARGVVLQEGRRVLANWVVAACDPVYVSRTLLKNGYLVERRLQARWEAPEQYPLDLRARLLFWADTDALPPFYTLSFPTAVIPAAREGVDRLRLTQYGGDPTFMRAGRALVAVDVPMAGREAFHDWEALALQGEPYLREKKRLTEDVCAALAKCFPGLKGRLEPVACHTPLTYADRTNAGCGACGFVHAAGVKAAPLTGRLPSVTHLLLAGHFLGNAGGAHAALLQGKFAAQRACADEHLVW